MEFLLILCVIIARHYWYCWLPPAVLGSIVSLWTHDIGWFYGGMITAGVVIAVLCVYTLNQLH